MESANFHHHQQQQEDHHHQHLVAWYQNPILNGTRNNTTNSRDLKQHINSSSIDLVPSPMVQDLGLPSWNTMETFMAHELQQLTRIKHEFSHSGISYNPGALSEIINSSPTSSIEDLHSSYIMSSKNHDHHQENMFLKTFSNGCQIKGDIHHHQNHHMNQMPFSEESVSYSSDDTNSCYRGTFSQILPTINISSLNHQSSTPSSLAISSSSFDINLPAALDHPFGSPTFDHGSSFSCQQPSSLINVHNLGGGLLKDNFLSYGLHQVHQPNHRQDVCHSKISPAFIVETNEAKRSANNYIDAKALKAKKSKLELRPSCAPLKVRKEKLGDRISALQQMVAPFGKTDTASVLMEAIGYIKFLQSQVETLSVPYMNSAQKTTRTSTRGGSINNGNEEMKRDLRSRGLCLVPLSCLSYVTYGGGNIWATP